MPTTASPPRDLTIDEFAHAVNKSPKTVRIAVSAGTIPSYKVGGSRRIPATYLDELRASAFNDYEAAIKRLVDAAPQLTAAQRDKLSVLLEVSA